MACIRRLDRDNAWFVDFRYCGRRIRRRAPVQTKTGAQMFEGVLRKRFLQLEAKGISPFREEDLVFSAFVERWMQDYVIAKNRYSTIRGKQATLRMYLLPAFAGLPLHAITSERIEHLAAAMRMRKLSAKSINNVMSVLRTCLASAVRWNLLSVVPTIPRFKAAEPGYKFLSVDELRRLVAATRPGYWRAFIVFLAHTGCRFGEAAAVKWTDLELEGAAPRVRIQRSVSFGVIGPTKNGRVRDIPLTGEVVRELQSLPRHHEFVFALRNGHLPKSGSANAIRRVCDRAGIRRISWHVLRHTFATELSARQVPLRAIQELLGHSSIAMTCRYAHVADRSLREAVAALPALG